MSVGSMVTDPSATEWLRESSVDEKFIPSVDDKAVAFHTMSLCLEKTLSFGSCSSDILHEGVAVSSGDDIYIIYIYVTRLDLKTH